MASSLFQNQTNKPNNFMQMLAEFNRFKKSIQGKNPQAMVQELLSSGKMSKEQFEQLKETAYSLQGFLK